MNRCIEKECGNEGQYMVDGSSYCKDHKPNGSNSKPEPDESPDGSAGRRLAGM